MNKKILLACALAGLAGGISAQKPEDHKKTAYTDSLGRYIIQVDMPLYLYVSTSPDETPRRLERSDIKENKPIYLDGPGKHHIRHQDAIHNHIETFDIYADGQAPRTAISFTGAPACVIGGVTYFGRDLSVSLKATDDLSGVKQIYFSTENGNFVPYKTPDVNREGDYRLSYYSIDNVGNVEDVKRKDFTVDLSPPVTSHEIAEMFKDEIISAKSRISLTASDNLSGVARTVYRFDSEPEKQYRPGTAISFSHLSDGAHTLYYYSEDNVKNVESEKSASFFLDKMPPIMSADVLGDRFIIGDKVYFSGRTKLKLTAVDNRSGVKEIRYSINGGEFIEYKDPFYLPSVAGRHSIRYFSVDEMGNSSVGNYVHNSGIIYVDLTGPVLSHEILNPRFQKGDVMFISPKTKIVLKAIDSESGLQHISYKIDGKTDEIMYEAPFSVNESGTHIIKYYGYDNVNNVNTREFEITVDGEGPEIFATFSVSRVDDATAGEPDNAGVYPSYVMLYLAATDLLTGNTEIFYSINGEREIPYTTPIRRFAKNSPYTVVVRAKDQLGNFSEKTVKFKTGDY